MFSGAGAHLAHVAGGGAVEDLLAVRVAVDGRHLALDEPEVVDDHLHHRREAVRRAARVRDDVVLRRVVLVRVHAEDDGHVLVLRRGADDDLLHGVALVGDGLRRIGEEAGRFDDDFDASFAPRDRSRVALGEDVDDAAIDEMPPSTARMSRFHRP